jgi:hypothetical protein
MTKHLYVISDAQHSYVKIGRSDDVEARLARLQLATPYPLHIAVWFYGLGWMEQTLHRVFETLREGNEWFERVGSLKHFIRFAHLYKKQGACPGDAMVFMALAAGLCEFDGESPKCAPDTITLLRTVGAAYLEQADAIEAALAERERETVEVGS